MPTSLPDLVVRLDLPRLMAYGASTWDWHRMHYDVENARARGFDGAVVDGQMFGALIARQVREWAGPQVRFRELEFRNRGFVVAPSTVTLRASVSARDATQQGERIEIATRVFDESGRCVVDGARTIVELPRAPLPDARD